MYVCCMRNVLQCLQLLILGSQAEAVSPHPPPFDKPRTAAGPEILFLSVSTSFETTLAGLRQIGDHQPWEGWADFDLAA